MNYASQLLLVRHARDQIESTASFNNAVSMRTVGLTALTMLLGPSLQDWQRREPLETARISSALGWLREGIAKQDAPEIQRYLTHAVTDLNTLLEG